jgi:CBS domain-containing protein
MLPTPDARHAGSMTTRFTRDRKAIGPIAEVTVGQAMHRGVITCLPETPLLTVARVLAAHRVHAVVVVEADGSHRGLVTDLAVVEAVADGTATERVAGSLAAFPAVTAGPEGSLEWAAARMAEHRVSHLVVVEPVSRRPIGMLSTLDVADALADLRAP